MVKFLPVLKIVTRHRLRKMLMLLSMHMTSVLFLVWFNNFTLTMGFYWSYTLLLWSPVLMHSCWGSFLHVAGFQPFPPTTYQRMALCKLTRSVVRVPHSKRLITYVCILTVPTVCQFRNTLISCLLWTTLKPLGSTPTLTLPVRSRRHG